jgi:hypothetical protein
MRVLRSPAIQWCGVVRSIAIAAALLLGGSLSYSAQAGAPLKIGQSAPEFSGTSATGAKISLSDYHGKTVVLEWTNHQCPYVRKHYGTNNMQTVQKQATTVALCGFPSSLQRGAVKDMSNRRKLGS